MNHAAEVASAAIRHPDRTTLRGQIMLTLSMLGRDVLAYHPKLAGLTGSIPAGLMLSQTLYWSRVLIERNDRKGWFWKTRCDWQRELALSKHEQGTARRNLRALPFWSEELRGLPAKMHFRINHDALARQIDKGFQGSWNWQDRQQAISLLGRPLLVFRTLADQCQSVTAAILLSHFLNVERAALRQEIRIEWHRYSFEALMKETSLSRAELIHARNILRDKGYLKERRVGIPPRSEWRLELSALIQDLQQGASSRAEAANSNNNSDGMKEAPATSVVDQSSGNRQSCLPENHKQERLAYPDNFGAKANHGEFSENRQETRVVDQLSGIRTTGNAKPGQLEIRNADNKMSGIQLNRCPDSGFLYKGLTTGKPTTSTTSPTPPLFSARSRTAESSAGGGGHLSFEDSIGQAVKSVSPRNTSSNAQNFQPETLIWPTLLLADERAIAGRMLAAVGDLAQPILDELTGQHAIAPIQQPLAYLRKLAMQAQAGIFMPSAAPRIAEQRRRKQAKNLPASQNVIDLTPEQRQTRIAQMRELIFGCRAIHPIQRSCETSTHE